MLLRKQSFSFLFLLRSLNVYHVWIVKDIWLEYWMLFYSLRSKVFQMPDFTPFDLNQRLISQIFLKRINSLMNDLFFHSRNWTHVGSNYLRRKEQVILIKLMRWGVHTFLGKLDVFFRCVSCINEILIGSINEISNMNFIWLSRFVQINYLWLWIHQRFSTNFICICSFSRWNHRTVNLLNINTVFKIHKTLNFHSLSFFNSSGQYFSSWNIINRFHLNLYWFRRRIGFYFLTSWIFCKVLMIHDFTIFLLNDWWSNQLCF